MHDLVKLIPSNPPCIVTFNGRTILDCLATGIDIRKLFNSISKELFYVPGLYSSWDNLSNWVYFEDEPWFLGFNPRDLTHFYHKTIFYKSNPFLEDSVLKLEKAAPIQEPAEWEFMVELQEEPVKLNLTK